MILELTFIRDKEERKTDIPPDEIKKSPQVTPEFPDIENPIPREEQDNE